MKVVMYHTNCNDGLISAYNLWKVFGSKDVIYIPVNYKPIQDMEAMEALDYVFNSYINSEKTISSTKYFFKDNKVTVDDIKEMELYVVDYSFPVEHFQKHINLFKSVLVLDHHDTAIQSYIKTFKYDLIENNWLSIKIGENAQVIFSEKESGAKLTYMYFNKGLEVPTFIELASDRDLWKFDLKYSRAFKYGCDLFQLEDFNRIDNLMKHSVSNIIFVGEKYENYFNARLAKIIKQNTFEIKAIINGETYRCAMINTFPDIASDICDLTIQRDGYDMAIAYNIDTRQDVACSLRSRVGLDSSKLSLSRGGGGHKRASGFTISLEEFNKIVTNKLIEVNNG